MGDIEFDATVNVAEDICADVDSTAMSAAVIDDGDSIVVPAEVDLDVTLNIALDEGEAIDVSAE